MFLGIIEDNKPVTNLASCLKTQLGLQDVRKDLISEEKFAALPPGPK